MKNITAMFFIILSFCFTQFIDTGMITDSGIGIWVNATQDIEYDFDEEDPTIIVSLDYMLNNNLEFGLDHETEWETIGANATYHIKATDKGINWLFGLSANDIEEAGDFLTIKFSGYTSSLMYLNVIYWLDQEETVISVGKYWGRENIFFGAGYFANTEYLDEGNAFLSLGTTF